MRRRKTSDGERDSFLIAFGIYGAVGFQLAFAVVAGLYLGYLGDEHWGTGPWLTLLGLIIGSVGGFYNLIRVMSWRQKRQNGRDD
jgi:F0F1-type ATP synthase assembly protein I